MSAFILSDVGCALMLMSYFKKVNAVAGDNLTLKLYTNDVTPTDTSVVGDFTIAEGGGYADITISKTSWDNASVVSNIAQITYPSVQFAFTGGLSGNPTVYGSIILDADGAYVGGARASATYTPVASGVYQADIIVQLSKGTPA